MLTYTAGSTATITYTCACLLKVNSKIFKKFPTDSHPPYFYFLSTFFFDSEVDGLK